MLATGGTVGLVEGIIDDTCLVTFMYTGILKKPLNISITHAFFLGIGPKSSGIKTVHPFSSHANYNYT